MIVKAKTTNKNSVIYKLLVKDNLKEFISKNRERLTGNSFFREFVPVSYCGKERNVKISAH